MPLTSSMVTEITNDIADPTDLEIPGDVMQWNDFGLIPRHNRVLDHFSSASPEVPPRKYARQAWQNPITSKLISTILF